MVEDKVEPRELNWRKLLPWTELFQGFRVALDLNKLLLAAGGILSMAIIWCLLAVIFNPSDKPKKPDNTEGEAWDSYKQDLAHWNLMHKAAGDPDSLEVVEIADLADSQDEYDKLSEALEPIRTQQKTELGEYKYQPLTPMQIEALIRQGTIPADSQQKLVQLWKVKPSGKLRTLPWNEDRGPNPFMLVSGQAGVPWEAGHFWDWLVTKQGPVLIEPLVKLMMPVGFFFNPAAGFFGKLYFLLVILLTVAIWALFGGAITRIAVIQVTRQEKIGLSEALRFTLQRYVHYLLGPIFPLIFMAIMVLIMIIFGVFGMIPILGDIFVYGIFWPIIVLLGLGMAVALIGLVGWPLMSATISAEGTDSWEAVSRSYSYVYQAPWNFLWYCTVSIAYGAVVVFFVGFVGSLMVYFGEFGIRRLQPAERDPVFLFVHAPSSFGWRELMLQGTKVDGKELVDRNGRINEKARAEYIDKMQWWKKIGAWMVSGFWLNLIFLLVVGFGYSYFWSSSTIIYLLMRHKVDDAEMDEVYTEEDDQEPMYTPPSPTPGGSGAPAPASAPGTTMVEAPTMRSTPATHPAPAPNDFPPVGDSTSASPLSLSGEPPIAPKSEPQQSTRDSNASSNPPGTT